MLTWLAGWLQRDRARRARLVEGRRHREAVQRRGGYMAYGDATKWAPPVGPGAASGPQRVRVSPLGYERSAITGKYRRVDR